MTPERIWAEIQPKLAPRGGCLVWTGYVMPNGYAMYRREYVHRTSYRANHGPIAPGMTVDHICKTRSCANPEHLRQMTQKENMLLGSSPVALNASKTHCAHGHPLSGDNILVINRPDGVRRKCRTCDRIWHQAKRAKRAAQQ